MLLAFRNYPLFLNSLASLSIKKLVFKFKMDPLSRTLEKKGY